MGRSAAYKIILNAQTFFFEYWFTTGLPHVYLKNLEEQKEKLTTEEKGEREMRGWRRRRKTDNEI